MQADANTRWQTKVRDLLKEGLGSEDIAVKLKCDVSAVRREIQILRESGELKKIVAAVKPGPTLTKLLGGRHE